MRGGGGRDAHFAEPSEAAGRLWAAPAAGFLGMRGGVGGLGRAERGGGVGAGWGREQGAGWGSEKGLEVGGAERGGGNEDD